MAGVIMDHTTTEKLSKTESELISALNRILSGRPGDPELKERLARGDSILSVKNVAQEAGLSRTLIGFEGCAYPRARQAVLEAIAAEKQGRPTDAVIRRLRSEIKDLKNALVRRDAYIAELVIENSRLRARYEPESRSGSTITPFRRDGRRKPQR